jgi:hypothetical protein
MAAAMLLDCPLANILLRLQHGTADTSMRDVPAAANAGRKMGMWHCYSPEHIPLQNPYNGLGSCCNCG